MVHFLITLDTMALKISGASVHWFMKFQPLQNKLRKSHFRHCVNETRYRVSRSKSNIVSWWHHTRSVGTWFCISINWREPQQCSGFKLVFTWHLLWKSRKFLVHNVRKVTQQHDGGNSNSEFTMNVQIIFWQWIKYCPIITSYISKQQTISLQGHTIKLSFSSTSI